MIDISDEDAAIKGLIENLQRADLTPIEEAKGYKQLVEPPYNMTQEAIAQRVGKSQTCIARTLALLELPEEIQELMPRGIISETHTRALRKISDRAKQIHLAQQAEHANGIGWHELFKSLNNVMRGVRVADARQGRKQRLGTRVECRDFFIRRFS